MITPVAETCVYKEQNIEHHEHQLICERAMMSKVCLRNAVEAEQRFSCTHHFF